MLHKVSISEIYKRVVLVNAESGDEALKIIRQKCDENKSQLDDGYYNAEISLVVD